MPFANRANIKYPHPPACKVTQCIIYQVNQTDNTNRKSGKSAMNRKSKQNKQGKHSSTQPKRNDLWCNRCEVISEIEDRSWNPGEFQVLVTRVGKKKIRYRNYHADTRKTDKRVYIRTMDEFLKYFEFSGKKNNMTQDSRPILCLDFDGVLLSFTSGWERLDRIDEKPVSGAVPGAMQFIRDAQEKFQVHIYSSRSRSEPGIRMMKAWVINHLQREFGIEEAHKISEHIEYPTTKPKAFLSIDDRCVPFKGIWPNPDTLLDFTPWNKRPKGPAYGEVWRNRIKDDDPVKISHVDFGILSYVPIRDGNYLISLDLAVTCTVGAFMENYLPPPRPGEIWTNRKHDESVIIQYSPTNNSICFTGESKEDSLAAHLFYQKYKPEQEQEPEYYDSVDKPKLY